MVFSVTTGIVAAMGSDGTDQSFQFHGSQGQEVDHISRYRELLRKVNESGLIS